MEEILHRLAWLRPNKNKSWAHQSTGAVFVPSTVSNRRGASIDTNVSLHMQCEQHARPWRLLFHTLLLIVHSFRTSSTGTAEVVGPVAPQVQFSKATMAATPESWTHHPSGSRPAKRCVEQTRQLPEPGMTCEGQARVGRRCQMSLPFRMVQAVREAMTKS